MKQSINFFILSFINCCLSIIAMATDAIDPAVIKIEVLHQKYMEKPNAEMGTEINHLIRTGTHDGSRLNLNYGRKANTTEQTIMYKALIDTTLKLYASQKNPLLDMYAQSIRSLSRQNAHYQQEYAHQMIALIVSQLVYIDTKHKASEEDLGDLVDDVTNSLARLGDRTTIRTLVQKVYDSKVFGDALQSTHVTRTVAFAKERNAQGLPVKIIIGTANNAPEDYSRIDARADRKSWIYLGDRSQDPKGSPYLQLDFNNAYKLGYIFSKSSNLYQLIDYILVDDSTFKFSQWGNLHIYHFANALKPDGQFVFCPALSSYGVTLQHFNNFQAAKAFSLKELQESNYGLITGMIIPFEEYITGYRKDETIKQLIDQLFEEAILPMDKKLLEIAFNDVEIKRNVPFPIASNYMSSPDDRTILIIAKNPRDRQEIVQRWQQTS